MSDALKPGDKVKLDIKKIMNLAAWAPHISGPHRSELVNWEGKVLAPVVRGRGAHERSATWYYYHNWLRVGSPIDPFIRTMTAYDAAGGGAGRSAFRILENGRTLSLDAVLAGAAGGWDHTLLDVYVPANILKKVGQKKKRPKNARKFAAPRKGKKKRSAAKKEEEGAAGAEPEAPDAAGGGGGIRLAVDLAAAQRAREAAQAGVLEDVDADFHNAAAYIRENTLSAAVQKDLARERVRQRDLAQARDTRKGGRSRRRRRKRTRRTRRRRRCRCRTRRRRTRRRRRRR